MLFNKLFIPRRTKKSIMLEALSKIYSATALVERAKELCVIFYQRCDGNVTITTRRHCIYAGKMTQYIHMEKFIYATSLSTIWIWQRIRQKRRIRYFLSHSRWWNIEFHRNEICKIKPLILLLLLLVEKCHMEDS